MMIMLDDVDVVVVVVVVLVLVLVLVDDDDVERTCTGPYAVRSDLEHQVNHDVSIPNCFHGFSSYEEGGPTGAGKTRCLAV